MIRLTRLNNERFVLNAIMIEQVQAYADTSISLLNGKKVFVKESEEEIIQKVTAFYHQIGFPALPLKAGEKDE